MPAAERRRQTSQSSTGTSWSSLLEAVRGLPATPERSLSPIGTPVTWGEAFVAAVARVPESRYLFNNTCKDILAVAGAMLDGELAYRQGRIEAGFTHLRRAIALDDALPYDEPWGWMQPTRHAYGALLLEQGRVQEAAAVYAADLGLDALFPAFFLYLLLVELRERRARPAAAIGALIAIALVPVAPAGVPVLAASLAALIGLRRASAAVVEDAQA